MGNSSLACIVRADREAEPHASDRLTVRIFRFGQWAKQKPSRKLAALAFRAIDMVWTRMIVGAELPASVVAGPGLRLRHWGRGIILHPKATLGSGVTLFHRVTIGQGPDGGVPTLGNKVYVGTGATILGGITIGDAAKIAAGAVVVKDVPAGVTVGGVPAKVIG